MTVFSLAPRPGARWAGGVLVGVHSINHLIVGPGATELMTWEDAMTWASSLRLGTYRGWVLPDVTELRLIVAQFPRLLTSGTWWTRNTHHNNPGDAVVQILEATYGESEMGEPDGDGAWGKHYKASALAVRLSPIEGVSFVPKPRKAANTVVIPASGTT